MTTADKNKLAALLLELDLHEVKADEKIASDDRDFESLKKINDVSFAIQTILEYLG